MPCPKTTDTVQPVFAVTMVGRLRTLPLLLLASAGGAIAAPFQADPQS